MESNTREMSTYTQIIYQVVFGTKRREPTMTAANRDELYKYVTGILKKHQCFLYQIGGVEDHLHILMNLHTTKSLSNVVKDIKVASSLFIKEKHLFPNFRDWQEGYGAFTYSIREKDILIEYIKNQEAHHRKVSFKDEFRAMLQEHGVEFDERYLL